MATKTTRMVVFNDDGTGAILDVAERPGSRFAMAGTLYSALGTAAVEWPEFWFNRDLWWKGVDMRATGPGPTPGSVVYAFTDASHGGDWTVEVLPFDLDTRHRLVLTDPAGNRAWILTEDNAPPIVWAGLAALYCLGSAIVLALITDCVEECGGPPAAVRVNVRFASEFPYLPICGKECVCKAATGTASTASTSTAATSALVGGAGAAPPAVGNVSAATTSPGRCVVSVSLLRVSYAGGDEGDDWRISTTVQGREFQFRQRNIALGTTSNFGVEVYRAELGHCKKPIELDLVCTGVEVDTPDPNEMGSTPQRVVIDCPGQKIETVVVNVDSAVLTFVLNVEASCGTASAGSGSSAAAGMIAEPRPCIITPDLLGASVTGGPEGGSVALSITSAATSRNITRISPTPAEQDIKLDDDGLGSIGPVRDYHRLTLPASCDSDFIYTARISYQVFNEAHFEVASGDKEFSARPRPCGLPGSITETITFPRNFPDDGTTGRISLTIQADSKCG